MTKIQRLKRTIGETRFNRLKDLAGDFTNMLFEVENLEITQEGIKIDGYFISMGEILNAKP